MPGVDGATPVSILSVPVQEAWDHLVDDLLRFRLLNEDWDGQGAEAPKAAIVDGVLEWVRQMRLYPQAITPVRVVPGVAGEVYLEWQNPSLCLTADVSDPAHAEWTLIVAEHPARHWVTDLNIPYFVSALPLS